jgi:DNA modification methylase
MINKIICGDCLEILKTLESESVDMCMTSPPYWGLRDYGTAKWEGGDAKCKHEVGGQTRTMTDKSKKQMSNIGGYGDEAIRQGEHCPHCGAKRIDSQLGLEKDYKKYIEKLCLIFDEVKRVLKPKGSLWVNIGDSYGGSGGDQGKAVGGERGGQTGIDKRPVGIGGLESNVRRTKGLAKSLVGIPERFAIAMTDRGWIRRNTIIWHKPSCMPSSATDRCTVDFEYLYFFVKQEKYYFEQQFDEKAESSFERMKYTRFSKNNKGTSGEYAVVGMDYSEKEKNSQLRNKRCVWKINTEPLRDEHFAAYPQKLCITPIQATCPEFICTKCGKAREKIIIDSDNTTKGCSAHIKYKDSGQKLSPTSTLLTKTVKSKIDKGYTDCGCGAGFKPGIVLDPFSGAGTTLIVAKKLQRNYIGIELNEKYIKMAEKRREKECGLLF